VKNRGVNSVNVNKTPKTPVFIEVLLTLPYNRGANSRGRAGRKGLPQGLAPGLAFCGPGGYIIMLINIVIITFYQQGR